MYTNRVYPKQVIEQEVFKTQFALHILYNQRQTFVPFGKITFTNNFGTHGLI